MKIKVININNSRHYSKKSFKKDDMLYLYCGRPSKLSNPFKIGVDGNRDEVIEKFKNHFNPNKLINYIKQTKPKILILGCYCKPKKCHCDIIKDILDKEFNPNLFSL